MRTKILNYVHCYMDLKTYGTLRFVVHHFNRISPSPSLISLSGTRSSAIFLKEGVRKTVKDWGTQ